MEQPRTKEDIAYDRLKEMILLGALPRGEFLSQRMLAERVDSAVITVRAALRQLENDRLIESVPQWGVRIPLETEDSVTDRYFLRELLEVGAVRRVVQRRDEIDGEELRVSAQACDELSAEPESDFQLYAQRHYGFHQIVIDLSGSTLLAHAYRRLWMRSLLLWNAHRGWFRGFDRDPRLHQSLVETILTAEQEMAVMAMIEHIRHGLELELDALQTMNENPQEGEETR